MPLSDSSSNQVFDVIVLGAGVVGSILAWRLAAEGYRVCVCDGGAGYAQELPVEQVRPEVVEQCRELGIFDRMRPVLSLMDFTAHFRNGVLTRTTADEDYVVSHGKLVDGLRLGLERVAAVEWDRVVRVSAQGKVKSVRLESGRVICGWLVVVATGEASLRELLDLPEEVLWEDHSMNFGWNMELVEPDRMEFPSLVFRTTRPAHGYEQLRICRTGGRLRAQFSTYWERGSARAQALAQGDARTVLGRTVEGLHETLGGYRVTTAVENWSVSLTRVQGGAEAGVLLAGDAAGLTGTGGSGLWKGLLDVKLLLELVPGWLRERATGREALDAYYENSARREFEVEQYARSVWERKMAVDRSAEWVARRLKEEYVPGWLERAWVQSWESGRWTVEKVGLPAWRKGVEMAKDYRDRRKQGGRGKTGEDSGGVLTAGHDDLAGADGLDNLIS